MSGKILTIVAALDDQMIVDFINDTCEFLKGHKVSFLSKYGPLLGSAANVVPFREYLVELI